MTKTVWLSVDDVIARLPVEVSSRTVRRWWKAGLFPSPVRVGGRRIAWRAELIEEWLEELEPAMLLADSEIWVEDEAIGSAQVVEGADDFRQAAFKYLDGYRTTNVDDPVARGELYVTLHFRHFRGDAEKYIGSVDVFADGEGGILEFHARPI